MRTLAKTATRPNYLFGLLPPYFKENDTYKDVNDEGLLERYFEIFCQEIDSEVAPYIDDAFYLFDAENLSSLPHSDPSVFLDHLGDLFGNPPYIGTEVQYKALIRYIRMLLQTKGTKQSIELFLALYGYKVYSMTEEAITDQMYDLTPTALKYDDSNKFDLAFNFYSDWDLVISPLPGSGLGDPGSTWLANLKLAIQKFLSPILATLNTVTYHS